jgi:predicted CoA-binding protein
MNAARDLSPFFAPRSIAVVGDAARATSSGSAIMQMLRQAGYGGRVVPVNPKGGTIFRYETVTSIGAIDPPVDLAVIVIRPRARRCCTSMMGTLPDKTEWFAAMESAGVPTFNAQSDNLSAAIFRDCRGS